MSLHRSLDARAIARARAGGNVGAALEALDAAAARLRHAPGTLAAAQALVETELALAVYLDPHGVAFAERMLGFRFAA